MTHAIVLFALGCTCNPSSSTSPTTTTPTGTSRTGSSAETGSLNTTTPTAATGSASTATTGMTASTGHTGLVEKLGVVFETSTGCVGGSYDDPSKMSAKSKGAVVVVRRHGSAGGCDCASNASVELDAATLTIDWGLGDCDAVFCCDLRADLGGVPSGTYTITDANQGPRTATTTVTVP